LLDRCDPIIEAAKSIILKRRIVKIASIIFEKIISKYLILPLRYASRDGQMQFYRRGDGAPLSDSVCFGLRLPCRPPESRLKFIPLMLLLFTWQANSETMSNR
jgi:hypothetical protein